MSKVYIVTSGYYGVEGVFLTEKSAQAFIQAECSADSMWIKQNEFEIEEWELND